MPKEKHTAARGTSKKKTIVTPPIVEPAQPISDAIPAEEQPATVALVPFTIAGWTLFDDTVGHHWCLDLDLAERARLVVPRDIRRTIKAAIKDGSLRWDLGGDPAARAKADSEPEANASAVDNGNFPEIIGVGGSHANNRPAVVRARIVVTTSGKGRTQETVEFLVNEEGALVLMARLRTPAAIAVTKQVVAVYLAVARGERIRSASAPRSSAILVAIEELRAEIALYKQAGLAPRGFIGPEGAARIAKREAEVVAATNMNHGDLDQALRGILQFGGTGTEWALLSPEKEVTLMLACSVFEQIMASVKKRAKAPKGFDVKLRIKGRGVLPEQLVLAIATFLGTPR